MNRVGPHPRLKLAGICAIPILANIAAWAWGLALFRHHPALLGIGLLAYGFGLRHAVDADHIAAIDNVTRKLMQEGKRPAAAGLFFSAGHSTVVILATIGVATTAHTVGRRLAWFQDVGGIAGTAVSAGFLFAIAAMNLLVLRSLLGAFSALRRGSLVPSGLYGVPPPGGLFVKLFRPLFGLIRQSWHMAPLGFLFGLGFDTATEIGLLGISAAQAAHGLPVWSILVFPALFTAGMTLVDTADTMLMLGAYGWAYALPVRRLYYNITITFISAAVALAVGGIEVLGLAQSRLGLRSPFWDAVGGLNGAPVAIGYAVIALFILSWAVAAVIYRLRGYERLDAL